MLLISRSSPDYQICVHNGYSEQGLKLKKREREGHKNRESESYRNRKRIERKRKTEFERHPCEPFHKPPLVPGICPSNTALTHTMGQSFG